MGIAGQTVAKFRADGNIPQTIGGADMLWFFVKTAGVLLAVLFWAARKLRLTVPLLYALTVPTLFRP